MSKKVIATIGPTIPGWDLGSLCVQLWGFWGCVYLTFSGSMGARLGTWSACPVPNHTAAPYYSDGLLLHTYGETEPCQGVSPSLSHLTLMMVCAAGLCVCALQGQPLQRREAFFTFYMSATGSAELLEGSNLAPSCGVLEGFFVCFYTYYILFLEGTQTQLHLVPARWVY